MCTWHCMDQQGGRANKELESANLGKPRHGAAGDAGRDFGAARAFCCFLNHSLMHLFVLLLSRAGRGWEDHGDPAARGTPTGPTAGPVREQSREMLRFGIEDRLLVQGHVCQEQKFLVLQRS